jgi:hypothetical protein
MFELPEFFSQGAAAQARAHHLLGEPEDASRGVRRAARRCRRSRNSPRVNIRNEVAIRVGVRSSGAVGHVSRKAFGSGQPGPLSNQENNNIGREQLADFIENSHAAVANEKRLADRLTALAAGRDQMRQKRRNLRSDCRNRKPIADRDL